MRERADRYQRPDLRPSTQELYACLWRKWLEPAFGNVIIGSMTPETWREWYLEQKVNHPGSLQPDKAYRLARTMLNTAVGDGLLRTNPCRVKGAGVERSSERPVVMPSEVTQLAGLIDPKYRAMVLLAAYCSLRFGELAGLRRARVDLLHCTVAIEEAAIELSSRVRFGPPKTAAGRRLISIPPELIEALEHHLAEYVGTAPDALLFTDRGGEPLGHNKFRPIWAAACRKAGVPGLHLHDLRHSGLTWTAAAGATTAELMYRAGHSSPTVAMRYQHAQKHRDQEIAERLGALMRSSVTEASEGPSNVVPLSR